MEETKSLKATEALISKLSALLRVLPENKAQELLDFGDFLLSRLPKRTPNGQGLGDQFAGVWQDDRTAEEIIADIRNSRVEADDREML